MNEIQEIQAALVERLPFQKQKTEKAFSIMSQEMQDFLANYIRLYGKAGISIPDIADSYAMFLRETMKEQVYFSKHKEYRYRTYGEVKDKVYNNPDFMRKYMVGLGLSTVLWPNHVAIYDFFKRFIDTCASTRGGYLEVGAGHGLFCGTALKQDKWGFYDIVDVSETSIALSRNALHEFLDNRNIRFIHEDFLAMEKAEYETVSIGEVLEHVEAPAKFIEKCRSVLSGQGRVYVSTCLNAPEPDHIYLFSSIEEVKRLFVDHGFAIEQSIYLPYEGYTVEQCEEEKLPVNVAYILIPR